MPTPLERSVANANSAGFLAPTATVSIPANGALVGDLIVVTVSTDSGNAANWGAMSGSGWTQFMLRDAGTNLPKIRGWWKISTTAAAQSYSVTLTGANWAQVAAWQSWQAGTFNPTNPVEFITSSYFSAASSPYQTRPVTLDALPTVNDSYVVTAFFSLWNNSTNAPAWGTRPSPWLQTTNRESTGDYHSQYQVRRTYAPTASSSDAATILTNNGISNANSIVSAANIVGIDLAHAVAMVQKESNGQHIWGHDNVTVAPNTYTKGGPVTPANYQAYRAAVANGTAGYQGVGICQLTYYAFLDQADALHADGAADMVTNCRVGFTELKRLQTSYGDQDGARRYNGSGTAAEAYGADYMDKLAIWQSRLSATSGTLPSVNFTVGDTISRRDVTGVYVINPAIDTRGGNGYAPSRFGASATGTRGQAGSGRARSVYGARTSGSAARQGQGVARLSVAGTGAGSKRSSGTAVNQAAVLGSYGRGAKRGLGVGLSPSVILRSYAQKPTEIPVFTGRPPEPTPLPLNQSRYLVQNILTKEWLHTDLPLTDAQVKLTLSGPCEINGKIDPELVELKDSNGYPLLRSWGNILYFELDGQIRAAAMITEDSYDDQSQTLAARGVSLYPNVIPYQGIYSVTQKDPLAVAVDMWNYVQSKVNSNLGVTVTRMGTAVPESQFVGNEMKSKTTGNPAQPGEYIPVADRVYTPYVVAWYDRKYCGSVINDMIKAAPADYIEQYSWNDDYTDVNKNILIAYPRVGRLRDDLAFVQGENIVVMPAIESNPDSFATGIMGVGAGEGSAAVREEFESIVPGRLRKIKTYYNTKITDKSQMKLLIAREFNNLVNGGYEVGTIIVDGTHENAPYGSYIVGDDIDIDILVPAYGQLRIRERIIGITLDQESNLVEIELKRSDSFYYGKEVET